MGAEACKGLHTTVTCQLHVYIQRQEYPGNWNLENRKGAPRLKQHFSRTFSNNEKNIFKK